MRDLKSRLSVQVAADFKEAFTGGIAHRSAQDILDICRVVSALDPSVKAELSTWFVDQQLSEYHVLYADTEDIAWLDRIDQRCAICYFLVSMSLVSKRLAFIGVTFRRAGACSICSLFYHVCFKLKADVWDIYCRLFSYRYRWFVTKLTEFERSGASNLFPADWEMGRRLTHDYCTTTREMLDRLMTKRAAELDSKLLTHAINHTAMFEALLCKRFPGKDGQKSPFEGLVWRAFERHMHVFVAAQDKNMTVFLEQVGLSPYESI